MDLKLVYKVGLDEKQIKAVNKMKFVKAVEIQMINMDDDLNLIHLIKKKIINVHLPSEDSAYNISYVLQSIKKENAYYKKLMQLFALKKEFDFGIVIHADTSLENLEKIGSWDKFIKLTNEYKIIWRLENVIAEREGYTWNKYKNNNIKRYFEKDEAEVMTFPLEISTEINCGLKLLVGKNVNYGAFPLLDICHYKMNRNHFSCSFDCNLEETMKAYETKDLHIHFNDAIGCGINEWNGVHGANFEKDVYLLTEIIQYLKQMKNTPTLILEVKEEDKLVKDNAHKLEKMIKKYLKK